MGRFGAVIGALLAGLAAGLGIAITVGAIGLYLIGLGAQERFQVAAAAALGVATTDGLYALLAALAGLSLQHPLSVVARPLTWLACAALLVLSVRTALIGLRRYRTRQAPAQAQVRISSALRVYLVLVGLTAVNPATVSYFLALVLGRQASGAHLTGGAAVVFGLAAFVGSAAWQLVLVGGGTALGRVIAGARAQLFLALASAAIIGGLGVGVLIG